MKSKTRLFIALGIIILGIAVYGYFKATPGAKDQENLPKIEITPKSFDLGEIKYGEVVNYAFKVKNLGNDILEIKRVATSCACTTAKINKEKLNPQEKADLLVTYDTGAMGELHGKGRQERIIYVKSNDLSNSQVEVMIKAYVKPR